MSETVETGQPGAQAETEIPANEAAQQEGQTTETTEQPAPSAPTVPKGWQARIDQLTRQKYEAERRAEAAEKLAAEVAAQTGNAHEPKNDIEALAQRKAEEILAQREYAAKTNAFADRGASEFNDFTQRCNVVASLGATERPEFMQIITDMPDGHRVVAALADDPDETSRILQLPAHKMALELARYTPKPAKKTQVSAAPAPIRPVDGAAAPTRGNPDNWSVEDHIKHRQERESRR